MEPIKLEQLEVYVSWNGREEYKCPRCDTFRHPVQFSEEGLSLGMCDSCLEGLKYQALVEASPIHECPSCGNETHHVPAERRQKWGVVYGTRCAECGAFHSDGEIDINQSALPRPKWTREQLVRYLERES